MLQEQVLSRKKRDALMRKTKSLSKALERAKKRDEKKETTTTTTKRRGRKRKVGRGKEKVKPEETEEDLEERLKKIKMEAEEEEPLLAIEQSKSPKKSPKKTNHKVAQVIIDQSYSTKLTFPKKMDDLSDLKAGDCVMIDPSDLDHSILPETRPLIARIIEVNMEDEYVRAEWMAMVYINLSLYGQKKIRIIPVVEKIPAFKIFIKLCRQKFLSLLF